MEAFTILERLCALPGPSGREAPVAEACAELLRPYVDELSVDPLGSVIGIRRCGRENAPLLMLDAHIDEIALMVTGVKEGYLCFRTIGGVDARMLPNREVTVLCDEPLQGVITCLPPHLMTDEQMDKAMKVEEMFIDVGLDEETAKKRVPVGTMVVFSGGCIRLGEDQYCGKALDDRACFAAILCAMEAIAGKEIKVDIAVTGTCQEEVGTRGATAAAWALRPDWCVAVDVTHAHTPDASRDKTVDFEKGAAIGVGPNMSHKLTQRAMDLADQNGIPWQYEVMTGHTGTNAWPAQVSREGVCTTVVSIPLKYMHSPIEVISDKDFQAVSGLLAALALDLS